MFVQFGALLKGTIKQARSSRARAEYRGLKQVRSAASNGQKSGG
jgi:hypothetical protein